MKLLLLFFIIILFALFGAIHGLRTRELSGENTSRTWHKLQAILHGFIAFGIAYHFSLIQALITFLFVLVVIWIVFDLSHNLTTKQRWYYAEDSGINGTLKRKIGERGILIVKGAALVIGLFFYLW